MKLYLTTTPFQSTLPIITDNPSRIMKLPKHNLPKEVRVHKKTPKHKKSETAVLRKIQKELKQNQMETDSIISNKSNTVYKTDEEKQLAKLERKRLNKHKIFYKKNNYSMTGRNGPRAVCG